MAAAEWSEDVEEKLVEIWKKHPCLYDTSAKAFSNRNSKRAAVEEMATALEKPADEITKRMKSMRTQFSRMVKGPASGSGRKNVTVHQQWIMRSLDFLRPHLKARDTSSSFQFSQEDDDSLSQLSEDGTSGDEMISIHSPSPEPSSQEANNNKHAGPSKRKQAKRTQDSFQCLQSIAESLAKPIEFPQEETDNDSIFSQYVASRLRQIKDQRIKTQLIFKINQAISEAEFCCLDLGKNFAESNPNAIHGTSGSYLGLLSQDTPSFQHL